RRCSDGSSEHLPELIGGQASLPQDALQDSRKDRLTGVKWNGDESRVVWMSVMPMATRRAGMFPSSPFKRGDHLARRDPRQSIWHCAIPLALHIFERQTSALSARS
ncbi:MAG: hypothetical protein ACRDQW_18805, partial [Haloechinothrix sp.]